MRYLENSEGMESIEGERRIHKVNRRLCPHCDKNVSYKTYKSHKRLYFDTTSGAWIINRDDNNLSNPHEFPDLSESMDAESPPGSPGHVPLNSERQEYDSTYGKYMTGLP